MSRKRKPARLSPRPASQRQLRVGELIRQALAEIFLREELRNPALQGRSITVCEVQMSPDLRVARCFVMPLGGDDSVSVLEALRASAAWLSGQVARRVRQKYSARLEFKLDTSFDYAARIDALLSAQSEAVDSEAGEPALNPEDQYGRA